MKYTILITALILSLICTAQDWQFEKPDYVQIEQNIKKKKSNLFYPSLMTRFKEADSTMTLKEKRHLYYGYVFEEAYSPYARSVYSDSLRTILQKEVLNKDDYHKIVKYTDSVLSENPFDLDAFNYQLFALEKQGTDMLAKKRLNQVYIILDALISSGKGTSKEEAFYVINTSHEYQLLEILGFEFGGTQSLIEHYDYLTVVENEAKIEGFYFDVSPCLNSMSKMFKD